MIKYFIQTKIKAKFINAIKLIFLNRTIHSFNCYQEQQNKTELVINLIKIYRLTLCLDGHNIKKYAIFLLQLF